MKKKEKLKQIQPDRKYLPMLIILLVVATVQLVFFFPYYIIQFPDLYISSPEMALSLLLIQVLVFIGVTIGVYHSFVKYSIHGRK